MPTTHQQYRISPNFPRGVTRRTRRQTTAMTQFALNIQAVCLSCRALYQKVPSARVTNCRRCSAAFPISLYVLHPEIRPWTFDFSYSSDPFSCQGKGCVFHNSFGERVRRVLPNWAHFGCHCLSSAHTMRMCRNCCHEATKAQAVPRPTTSTPTNTTTWRYVSLFDDSLDPYLFD